MKNMVKNRLALTAALLLAGCASSSSDAPGNKVATEQDGDMGQCTGVNSCKGTTSCAASGQNHCAGQNTCKGKGWLPLSKAECNTRGGKFLGFNKTDSNQQ